MKLKLIHEVVGDHHPGTLTKSPEGDEVLLDNDVRELIQLLWRYDIKTIGSCQGTGCPIAQDRNETHMWVSATDINKLPIFLNIIDGFPFTDLSTAMNYGAKDRIII